MKLLQIIIAQLFMSISLSQAQEPAKAEINWLSFEQLDDSLATSPKPVLLFFHTDWCSYCKKMLDETFQNPQVIQKLNKEYYCVQFDAETADMIQFDGVNYTNDLKSKRRGNYHTLAKLILGNPKQYIFPTTILLDSDFNAKKRTSKYLSIKELLKIL
ncbi:thioredoxin family protein [Sphingobacterium hotanense]|uniref:Thioredoxin family protein n=1 Tax=Sphingobacterium hotanense TaxID=649196 RepID=A0ABT7NJU8_9SPHI|nr:thioredoxin family protein [Sphingobacterium hotanense]MDM1047443.1 thioredoxin family protein [Sphingobacterium hotanense]